MFEKLHFREKVRLDCFPRIRMEKFRIRILNHIENFRIQDQDPYNNSYDQSHSFNFIYSNFFTLHSTIKLLNTRITTTSTKCQYHAAASNPKWCAGLNSKFKCRIKHGFGLDSGHALNQKIVIKNSPAFLFTYNRLTNSRCKPCWMIGCIPD